MTSTTHKSVTVNPFSQLKLLNHLDRLQQWKQTGDTTPVQIGLDVTNVCNHRCPMCNGAEVSDHNTIPLLDVKRIVSEAAALGVKAVTLSGGGDPTCHPDIAEILYFIHEHGLEAAMFTNGQLMPEAIRKAIVDCCTWVRVSLDADGPALFQETHGMNGGAFQKVLDNTKALVELRAERKTDATIGTSFLIGAHTIDGIVGAAKIASELGVDYIRLRPFFTWGGDVPFQREDQERVIAALETAQQNERDDFKVSYPEMRTTWVGSDEPPVRYTHCHVHRFVTAVTADMKVYLCCHTKDAEKYVLGDLRTQSFAEIWNSQTRREVYTNIDFKDCAYPCMLSAHNELLHAVANPSGHANFL